MQWQGVNWLGPAVKRVCARTGVYLQLRANVRLCICQHVDSVRRVGGAQDTGLRPRLRTCAPGFHPRPPQRPFEGPAEESAAPT